MDGDELEMFINVTGTSRVQAHKLLREANVKGQAVDEAIRCALCALHPASGLCLDTPVVLCSVGCVSASTSLGIEVRIKVRTKGLAGLTGI